MSDLTEIASALVSLETAVTNVEESAREHARDDANRFLQVHSAVSDLHHRLDFVSSQMIVLQDSVVEGFRKLGAIVNARDPNEVTPPARPKRDS